MKNMKFTKDGMDFYYTIHFDMYMYKLTKYNTSDNQETTSINLDDEQLDNMLDALDRQNWTKELI